MRPGIASMLSSRRAINTGITLVQQKSYSSSAGVNPHSITLDAPPTSGNFLIMCMVGDANQSPKPPTGWTNTNADAVDFSDTCINWKISNGTEQTINVSLTVATNCLITVFEYRNINNGKDGDFTAIGLGPGPDIVLGPCANNSAGQFLFVALVGLSNGNTTTPDSVASWSNGFTSVYNLITTGGGTVLKLGVAIKLITKSGVSSESTTATLDAADGSSNNSGVMISFKS